MAVYVAGFVVMVVVVFAYDDPAATCGMVILCAVLMIAGGIVCWLLFTAAAEALELLRDIRESLRR